MMKAYLLAYNDEFGTRDTIKGFLNSMDEIVHWRYDMPHSFYLISEASANDIANRLHELNGGQGLFIVTEIAGNEQGWLLEESWYLINNKQYKPK